MPLTSSLEKEKKNFYVLVIEWTSEW